MTRVCSICLWRAERVDSGRDFGAGCRLIQAACAWAVLCLRRSLSLPVTDSVRALRQGWAHARFLKEPACADSVKLRLSLAFGKRYSPHPVPPTHWCAATLFSCSRHARQSCSSLAAMAAVDDVCGGLAWPR